MMQYIIRMLLFLSLLLLSATMSAFASPPTKLSLPQSLEELFFISQNSSLTFVRCMGYDEERPWSGCWRNGKTEDGIFANEQRQITLYTNKKGVITSKRFGKDSFSWSSANERVRMQGKHFDTEYTLVKGVYLVNSVGKYMVLAKPNPIPMLDDYFIKQAKAKEEAEKKGKEPRRNLEMEENLRILDEALQ